MLENLLEFGGDCGWEKIRRDARSEAPSLAGVGESPRCPRRGAEELAQKTYQEVDDLLAGASDKQMASIWSRIRVRLGEASSALGGEKYEEALALLDEVDRWAEAVRGEESAGDAPDSVRCTSVRCGGGATDRLGSGAHANAGVRRYDAASRAMKLRRASLGAIFRRGAG